MTVQSNQQIKYFTNQERKEEAVKEYKMSADIAEDIYLSRENRPNESQLMKKFYYSLYHVIKGISVMESGKDYKKHSSLISYFNRESKKEEFQRKIIGHNHVDEHTRKGINDLFIYRDKYDYEECSVEEEDYQDAEKIWLEIYPELENILSTLIQ